MLIRRLQPQDASEYRSLRLRALWEHPEAFTSSYEEDEREPLETSQSRLDSLEGIFWGAWEDDQLCGMVGLEHERRAKNRHKGNVVGLYVAGEYTRRGLGYALLQTLIDESRAEGLELLVLTVTAGDNPAVRLYESVGFRIFGTEPRAIKVDGRPYAKHHMVLELTPSL